MVMREACDTTVVRPAVGVGAGVGVGVGAGVGVRIGAGVRVGVGVRVEKMPAEVSSLLRGDN